MTSYASRRSLSEYVSRKPDLNFPELAEPPIIPQGVTRDAPEDLQRLNEQLRQNAATLQVQNKELDAYAHVVAHDIKDPLAIIVMSSDLINSIPDIPRDELTEYVQEIRSTAYEINRIVDNLLLFAEVREVQAVVGPVRMAPVVEKVRDRLSYMIREQQAHVEIPKAWPDAIGYGPWIEEVWANYIGNALKYAGRPARVELGASSQLDGMVRFWTRDNGPGIPPAARSSLFTAFNQVGQARDLRHGLGLSIVLHIVEKLGGQVGVESELGKGSLFYFTLPAGPYTN